MNPRSLFRPKLPELQQQCESCPFRSGNDAAFAVILNRLRKMMGLPPMKGKAGIKFARAAVRADIALSGDFACHHTAYEAGDAMTMKPRSEWRQCPGATEAYRTSTP